MAHNHKHNHNHHGGHHHSHDGGAENIKAALILNLLFTVIEIVGGLLTNSLAILSDAFHDFGDSVVLVISFLSTKLSKKKSTSKHTFGFKRASLFAALMAGLVLLGGSILIIVNAIPRLFEPQEVHSLGIIALSVVGIVVNGLAVLKTRKGQSQNEKIVSWHMLEDVLNWGAVFLGGVLMKLTGWYIIDPVLTICSAGFILVGTCRNLFDTFDIFMESVPSHINRGEIEKAVLGVKLAPKTKPVLGIHDIHIWSLDGETDMMTAHVVVKNGTRDIAGVRKKIKEELTRHHIEHATIEIEYPGEATCCLSGEKYTCALN